MTPRPDNRGLRSPPSKLRAVLPAEAGILGPLLFKNALTSPAPTALPLRTLTVGHGDYLTVPTDSFDKLLEIGRLAFVREKKKEK